MYYFYCESYNKIWRTYFFIFFLNIFPRLQYSKGYHIFRYPCTVFLNLCSVRLKQLHSSSKSGTEIAPLLSLLLLYCLLYSATTAVSSADGRTRMHARIYIALARPQSKRNCLIITLALPSIFSRLRARLFRLLLSSTRTGIILSYHHHGRPFCFGVRSKCDHRTEIFVAITKPNREIVDRSEDGNDTVCIAVR
jgi:hypothetical protein